jgi:hypothetical protein
MVLAMHTLKTPVPCCTRLESMEKYLGIFNMDNERHFFFTGRSIHCTTVFYFPIWWCSWGQSSISWCSQIWLLMTGTKLNTHSIYLAKYLNRDRSPTKFFLNGWQICFKKFIEFATILNKNHNSDKSWKKKEKGRLPDNVKHTSRFFNF